MGEIEGLGESDQVRKDRMLVINANKDGKN